MRREALLLARITWFAGVLGLVIAIITKHDPMLTTAGLLIAGSTVGYAVAADKD